MTRSAPQPVRVARRVNSRARVVRAARRRVRRERAAGRSRKKSSALIGGRGEGLGCGGPAGWALELCVAAGDWGEAELEDGATPVSAVAEMVVVPPS
jgi:hypothetical protein